MKQPRGKNNLFDAGTVGWIRYHTDEQVTRTTLRVGAIDENFDINSIEIIIYDETMVVTKITYDKQTGKLTIV